MHFVMPRARWLRQDAQGSQGRKCTSRRGARGLGTAAGHMRSSMHHHHRRGSLVNGGADLRGRGAFGGGSAMGMHPRGGALLQARAAAPRAGGDNSAGGARAGSPCGSAAPAAPGCPPGRLPSRCPALQAAKERKVTALRRAFRKPADIKPLGHRQLPATCMRPDMRGGDGASGRRAPSAQVAAPAEQLPTLAPGGCPPTLAHPMLARPTAIF